MKPSEGPERILLGFIIVYLNTLNHPHHHRRQKEKAAFISKKKKKKKVKSRQMFASKSSQVLVSNWYTPHVLSSVISLQGCCVAPQYRKSARSLRGGAVIVTVRCRITALEQVVIRVAEV